jgi:hypothetical protein
VVQGCASKVRLGIVHSLLEEGDELGRLVASVEEAMEEELEFLHDILRVRAELMDAEDVSKH